MQVLQNYPEGTSVLKEFLQARHSNEMSITDVNSSE